MKKIWMVILVTMLLFCCQGCKSEGLSNSSLDGSALQEQVGDNQVNTQGEAEVDSKKETELEETQSTPEIKEIIISAVGDCTLGTNQKQSYSNSFDEYYDKYGEAYFLKNIKSVFEEDDFTIINLEGTLTNSENIRTSKEWNHKGKPEYVNILSNASVEAVTLGNNHIMDYQQDGVDDTIATVEGAGLSYALSGDWGNQFGLYETKGVKIGFVSVNEYYDGNRVYDWLEDGLAKLREQGADIVIAAMHWGGDKIHTLEENQRVMGKWCIDQGFDLVLGSHPHVLQGIEEYNGKYIVYSMGNFCYGGSRNPAEKESMIFQASFTFIDGVLQPQTDARVIPCRLSSVTDKNDYCPVVLEGEEAREVLAQLNSYSEEFGLVIDETGHILAD